MASSLPYVVSNKNLAVLFQKISAAKVPDKFTHTFLQQTIGLKGTNDRAYIPLLRALGFLDNSGSPTASYRQLKNSATAKLSVASGVRTAYAPLFAADESAHALPQEKLKGLVAQVAGTDEGITSRIASTFSALAKLGDFTGSTPLEEPSDSDAIEEQDPEDQDRKQKRGGLKTEFHYNIQIHLPSNGTEEMYLNIFNALRKVFQ